MKTFRVVADSSCLIGLAKVNQFELLKELFLEVYIPDAVYDEVVVNGKGESGSDEVESALKSGWILKRTVTDKTAIIALETILGRGESECIILCKELKLDYTLIDERTARHMAELLNVNTIGTLGIIEIAFRSGIPINKKEILDKLIDIGFRISDELYRKILFT